MSSHPATDAQYHATQQPLGTSASHGTNRHMAGANGSETPASQPPNLPIASNGDSDPHHGPLTPSYHRPLTAATLAAHNANSHATILAEENAARARIVAMQGAAHRMKFELPHEDAWTGKRSREAWLDSQARTYGRFVGPQPGERKP